MSEKSPFGNLSFRDYTLETPAEKLVIALQAALKTEGFTPTSAAWTKFLRLKKALKRDKRYSFKLLPREGTDSSTREQAEKVGPEEDLSPILAEVVSHCLGIPLRKKSVRNTTAGYAVVRATCLGDLKELRIPPGPEDLVTEARFKEEVAERCFFRDVGFNQVSVVSTSVKKSKKRCLVTVEVMYK